jgi:heat-inducible transcriptional repressor
MDKLSNRQKKLFKIIVDTYIQAAQPISSKEIIEKHIKDVSSATIRNDMNVLEKMGLLVKTHTSSGRVPTSAGYMYYEKSILEPNINVDVKNKLRKIFNNRELSINTILDQSVEILKESLQLPLVLSSAEDAETLKRFDLIQINNREALVIIVTNNGNVIKNTISFTSDKQFDDIAICIRVFNDRLVDYPISKLKEGILSIKEVIRNMVHEYEFCIRQIVEKLFAANEVFYKQELHGTKYLTHQPEFQDVNKLNKILSFLENTNV